MTSLATIPRKPNRPSRSSIALATFKIPEQFMIASDFLKAFLTKQLCTPNFNEKLRLQILQCVLEGNLI